MIYKQVAGVRFAKISKIYNFDSGNLNLSVGDDVIVETARGKQIGSVAQIIENYESDGEQLKTIERLATPRDLVSRELLNTRKGEVLEYCKKQAEELNVKGVKFLDADFSFDGTRVFITFSAQNDEKVDTKTLRYDVQKEFSGLTTADIRQLGPRDVAKAIGGIGACGMPNRCCSTYLTEFNSISIKMAKEQGISLTPAEITGMCGRLRCCLVYENDYYVECRKYLPKKNKRVMTPQGEGKVLEVFPLRGSVLVDVPETGRREYTRDQITYEDQLFPTEEDLTHRKPDPDELQDN